MQVYNMPRQENTRANIRSWEEQAHLQPDEVLAKTFARMAQELVPGNRVLIIGSGTGALAFAAWERVKPAGQVDGIDISNPMVAAVSFRIPQVQSLMFQRRWTQILGLEWQDHNLLLAFLMMSKHQLVLQRKLLVRCTVPSIICLQSSRNSRWFLGRYLFACVHRDFTEGTCRVPLLHRRHHYDDQCECKEHAQEQVKFQVAGDRKGDFSCRHTLHHVPQNLPGCFTSETNTISSRGWKYLLAA
jgi:SAM-dependent methyltransferase